MDSRSIRKECTEQRRRNLGACVVWSCGQRTPLLTTGKHARERERRWKERGDARSVGKNSQRTTSRGTEERVLREREMEVSGVTSGSRRDRQRRPVQGCTARNGRTAPSADSSSRQRTWRGTGPHVVGEGETDGRAFLGRGERPRRRQYSRRVHLVGGAQSLDTSDEKITYREKEVQPDNDLTQTEDNATVAAVGRAQTSQSAKAQDGGRQPYCVLCRKSGHATRKCRYRPAGAGNNGTCFTCGGLNHRAVDHYLHQLKETPPSGPNEICNKCKGRRHQEVFCPTRRKGFSKCLQSLAGDIAARRKVETTKKEQI